ncbi:hypothetical protein ABIE65_004311 [Constrictibacter sp. MBR-5]|jgi:hypothetical protein|uniref:baeRF3 domain-containing protein n=1 Tax=Constrictibacter sp. MBR-5 TaxID=3156467 RepID=UPI003393C33C
MIDIDRIVALSERTGFPRVSIFMPTHRMGAETRQDPIRLGNLLRRAADLLQERGLTPVDVDRLLAHVREHATHEANPFWQHQDRGLAAYVGPDATEYVSVPLDLAEQVHVGDRFLVRPLLPVLARDGVFHVLAASQDTVTLYRASRYGMTPVKDERLPASAAYFTERTDPTNAVGYHSNSGGGTSIQVHGLGESPQDAIREQVDNFSRAVAKATDEILADAQGPLVLAADDRLLGMLRQHLHHRHAVPDGIREHPTALGAEALHEKAYALVRDRLDAARRSAMERFEARRASGDRTVATRIEEIVPAAVEGRIEALVVGATASATGVYSESENRAIVSPAGTAHTTDLVDFAVVRTLSSGGAVYARPADAADDYPSLAAVYRY